MNPREISIDTHKGITDDPEVAMISGCVDCGGEVFAIAGDITSGDAVALCKDCA